MGTRGRSGRGKLVAFTLVVLALVAVLWIVLDQKDALLESWYLSRVESAAERGELAEFVERLARVGSERGVRRLFALADDAEGVEAKRQWLGVSAALGPRVDLRVRREIVERYAALTYEEMTEREELELLLIELAKLWPETLDAFLRVMVHDGDDPSREIDWRHGIVSEVVLGLWGEARGALEPFVEGMRPADVLAVFQASTLGFGVDKAEKAVALARHIATVAADPESRALAASFSLYGVFQRFVGPGASALAERYSTDEHPLVRKACLRVTGVIGPQPEGIDLPRLLLEVDDPELLREVVLALTAWAHDLETHRFELYPGRTCDWVFRGVGTRGLSPEEISRLQTILDTSTDPALRDACSIALSGTWRSRREPLEGFAVREWCVWTSAEVARPGFTGDFESVVTTSVEQPISAVVRTRAEVRSCSPPASARLAGSRGVLEVPWVLEVLATTRSGLHEWRGLRIGFQDKLEPKPVESPADARWLAPRDAPGSWLAFRGASERFLRLEGLARFGSPVSAAPSALSEDIVFVTVPEYAEMAAFWAQGESLRGLGGEPEPIPAVIVVSRAGARLRIGVARGLAPGSLGVKLSFPPDAPRVLDDLVRRQFAFHGLHEADPDAFLTLWADRLFDRSGTWVVVFLPRWIHEALVPFEFEPWPASFVRAGILRFELGAAQPSRHSPTALSGSRRKAFEQFSLKAIDGGSERSATGRWRVDRGRLVDPDGRRFKLDFGTGALVGVTDDGQRVLISSEDRIAVLYFGAPAAELADRGTYVGDLLIILENKTRWTHRAAMSRDGKIVVATIGGAVYAFGFTRDEAAPVALDLRATDVAVSADGWHVLVVSGEGEDVRCILIDRRIGRRREVARRAGEGLEAMLERVTAEE